MRRAQKINSKRSTRTYLNNDYQLKIACAWYISQTLAAHSLAGNCDPIEREQPTHLNIVRWLYWHFFSDTKQVIYVYRGPHLAAANMAFVIALIPLSDWTLAPWLVPESKV